MKSTRHLLQNIFVLVGLLWFSAGQSMALEFTFSTDVEGWGNGGNWEAEFGEPAIEHSTDVGNGTLQFNANLSGADDWQELRIVKKGIGDLTEFTQLTFTFYLPKANVKPGTLKPYVVLDPGWVKLGIEKTNTDPSTAPTETINGVEYAVIHVTIDLTDTAGKSDLYIGFVGYKLPYTGAVYLDDVQFLTAAAPEADAATGVIDDFEGYSGDSAKVAKMFTPHSGGGPLTVSLGTDQKQSGEYGLKYEYDSSSGYSGVTKNLGNANWSGATAITFWLQPDGSGNRLVIQFKEGSGEYWEYSHTLTGSEAQIVSIPVGEFAQPPWGGGIDGELDLSSIVEFSVFVNKTDDATAESGTLYFDDFTAKDATGVAASPDLMEEEAEAEAADIENYPHRFIEHRGQQLFLSGINLAWINFGRDLDQFNEKQFVTALDEVAAAKGNAIRWWLHVNGSYSPLFDEDGKVSGLGPNDIESVKCGLDLAFDRGIGLVLSLWSFDMLQDQHGVDQERNKRLVEDPEYTQSYIDNALIPMVTALKGHPGILAWEICNEPEGMTKRHGWTPVRTEMKYVQQFVNLLAGAIHRADPDAKVTNGTWSLQVQTDVGGMTNYYRDDRLIEAGGDHDGTLDFYQAHYYPQHAGENTSPFHHPVTYWQLDKPLLIGEFPAKGIKDIGFGYRPRKSFSHIIKVFDFAYQNGYAGALGWTWTNHDGFGGILDASAGTLWLNQKYPEHIALDTSSVDKTPRVLQEIETAVFPLNSPAVPEYVNLKTVFEDVEDGAELTFLIEQNSNPHVIQASIQESGALMLEFAPEATGMADVTVKAIDSADNYAQVAFSVHIIDPDQGNVAFMKPATASSLESAAHEAYFANDGDLNTRWSTQYEDNHWLQIDLEGNFLINQVVLKWEVAYGKVYEIQISEDGENWTTIFSEQSGDGETDDIMFEAVPAHYVRMFGIQRGTQWGFSLWEFEVYGKRIDE